MPDAPDLEGLLDFSKETARNSGRFFVGRDAELALIGDAASLWMRGVELGNAPFGLVLISGAPGAGKTALLHHLARNPPPSVAALSVPLLRLSSEAELARSLKDALTARTRRGTQGMRPTGVAANLGLAKFSWRLPQQAPATLGDLERGLSGGGTAALMLPIDEVQTATPEPIPMLSALHLGAAGIPLVPVLAGLSDAGDVLASGGISRRAGEYDVRLGTLNAGEPAEAVRQMLDEFRTRGSDETKHRWCRAVEATSDRWPQHLKTSMTALARELLRTGGDLERADLDRALHDAAALRARGYEARRSPDMGDAEAVLAEFLATTQMPVGRRDALDALRRLLADDPMLNFGAQEFFGHLIHQGVLHDPNGDSRYVCPIPSFREHLIERGSIAKDTSWSRDPQPFRINRAHGAMAVARASVRRLQRSAWSRT